MHHYNTEANNGPSIVIIAYAYTTIHESTNNSLYYLMFGFQPSLVGGAALGLQLL